jgi:regulatory protein
MPLRVPARRTAGGDGARDGAQAPSEADPKTLRQRALRLLAQRERSRAEMERLLAPRCGDADQLRSLLDDLQARGWLSDARLAGLLVGARRSRASATRIRRDMARRGLAADLIAEATTGLEQSDLQTAFALWQKRFGTPAADRTQRERQLRFLLYRGFSQAVALKVLRLAASPDLGEIEE